MNIMNLYVYENRSMSNDLSRPLMLENLNVDTVQIHIPKEIDGTDMGTWAWWFVYQNAKREKYSIPLTLEAVTNDEGEEEYISTTGLNHGFTGKHGTVMYAIEAIQADGSGTVTHEWHTKTCKLEVIYTLQGNQTEYDETETDIISALISRVNELIQSGAEIAEIAATIEAAAETAQEVIDSIPQDYSELSGQVDENTEDITQLKADLDAYNSVDVLPTFADYKQTLSKGVTYTWSGGVCTMSGTSTSASIDNLYYDTSALPSKIIPGKTYRVRHASTAGTQIYCNIVFYEDGVDLASLNFYGDGEVYIPELAQGMAIRIRMASGVVATGHSVSLSLMQAPSNSDLAELVNEDRYSNTKDVAGFFNRKPKTSNGITFTWNGTTYVIDGTSTGGATYELIESRAKIPGYIIPGEMYRLSMRLPYPAKVEIVTLVNKISTTTRYETDADVILPTDITGIIVRLYITTGYTFAQQTGNVSFTRISNRRLMTDSIAYTDGTNKGVTFTWQDGTCTLNGDMGDNQFAFNALYNDETALPPDILPGHSYYCEFDSTDDNVGLEALVRLTDGRYTQTPLWVSGMVFDVPTDAVGMIFRLRCVSYKTFSGGTIGNIRIYEYRRHYKMPKLLVSFIDDDASADNYVTQYHDACMRNGIRGNYAVMPKRLDDEVTSVQNLLDYELEGFGMLVHAYEQNQACWRAATYDYDLAYADLLLGCRKMQAYGFTDFRYWVYPEGHRWKQIERIARKSGMKCALGTDSYDYNYAENAERFFIKRCSFNPNDENLNKSLVGVKAIVDKAVADGRDVWLIITTHFNTWENYMTYDTTVDSTGYAVGYPRFNELVQYVLGKGFEAINIPGGFTYYEPYLVN